MFGRLVIEDIAAARSLGMGASTGLPAKKLGGVVVRGRTVLAEGSHLIK